MQKKPHTVDVRVLVEVIDALRIESRSATDDPMHLITFAEQKLSKVRTILARNTSYKSFFHGESFFGTFSMSKTIA